MTTTRVTVIDPVPLSAEHQARAWLAELDAEREDARGRRGAQPRPVRPSHRHRRPLRARGLPAQALVIRAGWGEGEQVADGRWLHARELPLDAGRRAGARRGGGRSRSSALRPQERLAELLGARARTLLCEELALRARLDLDQGRLPHAAVELDGAFAAALPELRAEGRQDLAIRIAELEQLRAGVAAQARAALPDETGRQAGAPDEDVVRHALERLEAALRARTATGFSLR